MAAAVVVVLFCVLIVPSIWNDAKVVLADRLPWVSRKRLVAAQAQTHRAHARARHATEQRDYARAMVDAILVASGQYGSAWTKGEPEAIAKAAADMDVVFTEAVQWRETDQQAGMAGTGYIAQLIRASRTHYDRSRRTLP